MSLKQGSGNGLILHEEKKNIQLFLDDHAIHFNEEVRNLGVVMDRELKYASYVSRNVWYIWTLKT